MPRPEFTDEQLIAFASGDVTDTDAALIEDYVATHPAAARTVEMYRVACARRAADDSVAPPRETVERAKRIFDRALAPIANWPERVVATVARLVFDSRLQPAAVRVEHGEDQFQLSFSTESGDIDLQAHRLEAVSAGAPRQWRVIGQYTADDAPQDLDVALFRVGQARPVATTRADDRAVFSMEVDAGAYEMRLKHADTEIVLPALEIK